MSGSNTRYLALAFAAADLLLEVDERWLIRFAMGAMPVAGQGAPEALRATDLMAFLAPGARSAVAEALSALKAGARCPAVEAAVVTGDGRTRPVQFRAFMMPDLTPTISCAISYTGAAQAPALAGPANLLTGPDALADRARDALAEPGPLNVSFVEVGGLAQAASGLGDEGQALINAIEDILAKASFDGASATRVETDRYAVLQSEGGAAGPDLAGQVRQAGVEHNVALTPVVETARLAPGKDPKANLRALRLTLDAFLRDGASGDGAVALNFSGAVMRTLQEADAFRARVRNGNFRLYFQPVVSLADGRVRHHEALARFEPNSSPAAMIRMAEEMSLIGEFDLAVADRAVTMLGQAVHADLKLAVNVSGQSLASDKFVRTLIERTQRTPRLRARLIIEVTESAALEDLDAAEARIQVLRHAGFKVAIDDFGAGAASFDYLRRLSVDSVKIDGAYIRDIAHDERAQKLVSHLVALCQSMGLTTVAEMIETQEAADVLRKLGVDHGQGWLYGKAAATPEHPGLARSAPIRARRQGIIEGWG